MRYLRYRASRIKVEDLHKNQASTEPKNDLPLRIEDINTNTVVENCPGQLPRQFNLPISSRTLRMAGTISPDGTLFLLFSFLYTSRSSSSHSLISYPKGLLLLDTASPSPPQVKMDQFSKPQALPHRQLQPRSQMAATPAPTPASPVRDLSPTVENALGWVLDVRDRLDKHTIEYAQCLTVFEDYVPGVTSVREAAERLSEILINHRDFLQVLSFFLPSDRHLARGIPVIRTHHPRLSFVIDIWCSCQYPRDREDTCPVCQDSIGSDYCVARSACCRVVTHARCLAQWARTPPQAPHTPRQLILFGCPHCRSESNREKIITAVEARKARPRCGRSAVEVGCFGPRRPSSAREREAARALTWMSLDSQMQDTTEKARAKNAAMQAKAARWEALARENEAENVKKSSEVLTLKLQRDALKRTLTALNQQRTYTSDNQHRTGDEQPNTRQMPSNIEDPEGPHDEQPSSSAPQPPPNSVHQSPMISVSTLPDTDMPLWGDDSQRDYDLQSSFMDQIDQRHYQGQEPPQQEPFMREVRAGSPQHDPHMQ